MTKQLTKQTIGVGVAGTGFIGPAHVEGLRRNGIQVLAFWEAPKRKRNRKMVELYLLLAIRRSMEFFLGTPRR
ncbi:MAG TPA: hypothetical protein VGA72_02315 [Anaerolineales bacterium]